MEVFKSVKSTKKDFKKGRIETNRRSTVDVEKDRIEHVINSTKESINNNDSMTVLAKLVKDISNGDLESAKATLTELKTRRKCDWLSSYQIPDQQGETVLHVAIKSQDDISLIEELSTMCPDLLFMARRDSLKFCGQTALHMAITKCNKKAIEAMLIACREFKMNEMSILLQTCATGFRFVNTVMMGQLPLTVAALTGNTEIVDVLLKFGADLHFQNDMKDTVFHSLIKYAATYPDKVMTIKQMMRHLNQKLGEEPRIDIGMYDQLWTDMHRQTHSFLWFVKNKENLTPLQLAAKHGVTELFEEILNLKNVYCYISANDGLFDVKEYDVTEIDTVSVIKSSKSPKMPKSIPHYFDGIAKNIVQSNETVCASCCSYPETESILEMLFQNGYDSLSAYRIIELAPVQYIIKMKWENYKLFFKLWMILHYAFMILLTFYSVYNVELGIPSVHGRNSTALSENFVYGFRWVSLAVGILYAFIVSSLIIAKFRKKYLCVYFFHNMEYIFPMLILSITVIIDVLWSFADDHDNIPLIIALICGWWLNVFFLSPYQKFSFFTELIKRVITGDLFRFGLVILFELFSFTAGMYIVFRGTNETDFSSYESTMMAMFKLGIGIDDISVLYSARIPWVAVVIFILFTTFTYLLMLNALIAMMSQTCSSVSEERFPQWRIQQLSIILVIEDLICLCCFQSILSAAGIKQEICGLDPKTKQIKTEDRYFLEIHALQMEYATTEDKMRVQKKYYDTQAPCNLTNEGVNENSKNELSTENSNTDELSPRNYEIQQTAKKKRIKQISPLFEEKTDEKRKNKKLFSTSQREICLNESNRATNDNDFLNMDTSSRRLTFARAPPLVLNAQNDQGQIECEIRTLTNH